MRTVRVDDDHVVEFSKTSKDTYKYRVRHIATNRVLIDDQSVAYRPTFTPTEEGRAALQSEIDRNVARAAERALRTRNSIRRDDSRAYADGKAVANAPAMAEVPPAQARALADGTLDVSAGVVVYMIQTAYRAAQRDGLSLDPKHADKAALTIGHQILIGATDAVILKIAHGKATLTGSLRSGVVYSELA